jgi:aminoglycoside phosphotransferase (APT) family kinase protein
LSSSSSGWERGSAPTARDAAWEALRADAIADGETLSGFHNVNYLLHRAAGHAALVGVDSATPLKVRVRRHALKVVERSWADEGAILRSLRRTSLSAHTPRYYGGHGDIAVHEFVPGTTLSEVCPPGKPLDPRHLDALIGQLAQFTRISQHDLPPLPPAWAQGGDSRAFLQDRVDFAEREVRRANWPEFAALFAALEVPTNALRDWRNRVPALRSRPFALLHGDLHRHNVIVRDDGELALVDWELAMWGDPLHDLAIHLVRMRYPSYQRWDVVERWRTAVGPEAAHELDRDLPVYMDFERAQSLFADTLRAARSLVGQEPQPGRVGAAVGRVRDALHLAAGPLRLNRVPSRPEVERALLTWLRQRNAAQGRPGTGFRSAGSWPSTAPDR